MEIKVGDKVRVSKDAPKMYFFGCNHDNSVCKVILVDRDNAVITQIKNGSFAIPTKYLIKVDAEAEKKPNVGSIKIPVEVDLSDSYWDAYTAELAKEIALKVTDEYSNPKEAADYAVSVAKAVVENLKKK